jgi:ABC-type multidrug transport system fused ATPase/permease subunit
MDDGSMSMLAGLSSKSASSAALTLAVLGVLAAIVKLVGGALSSGAEAGIAGEVAARVRLSVLDDVLALRKLHGARQDDHGSSRTASIGTDADRLAALTSHVAEIERGVAHGVLAEVRAIVMLVPLGALLVILAPKLAGSAVVALVAFGVLAFGLRRAFKRAHVRASASAGALVAAADEAVKHAELWATYGAKRRIRAHVAGVGRAIARESARIRMRASLLSSTSEVLGALALVLALLLASRGALGVDHGTVVPFAIAFFMAYRPLRDLVDARLARARGEEALRAATGDLALERPDVTRPASRPCAVAWKLEDLALEGVRTRHGAHGPLTLTIPAGAIAAIVGPTGIGKTSLLRVLLGLEPLVGGEVHYGTRVLGAGRDASDVGPHARPFAWVPQDAPIVGDTLAINVGLGRADDDAAVPDPRPVLAQLGNEGLVDRLGDVMLGTKRRISGGERQWIAVARALATGLPVLLLDEPTSALDPASQARLLEAIARLRGKRTVLLVTHRPEPLAIADIVVRIERPQSDGAGAAEDVEGGPSLTA